MCQVCLLQYSIHCQKKLSKCGVFSGSYFPAFGPNTGNYGPEKTPYLDIFHTVKMQGYSDQTKLCIHLYLHSVNGLEKVYI